MQKGAPTPEDLETLLEDAFVMHDRAALSGLFEPGAVLSAGPGLPVAQGRLEVIATAEAMWARKQLYLAAPTRVLQARDTALITGARATSVARRSQRGAWRYVIAFLHTHPQAQRSTS